MVEYGCRAGPHTCVCLYLSSPFSHLLGEYACVCVEGEEMWTKRQGGWEHKKSLLNGQDGKKNKCGRESVKKGTRTPKFIYYYYYYKWEEWKGKMTSLHLFHLHIFFLTWHWKKNKGKLLQEQQPKKKKILVVFHNNQKLIHSFMLRPSIFTDLLFLSLSLSHLSHIPRGASTSNNGELVVLVLLILWPIYF